MTDFTGSQKTYLNKLFTQLTETFNKQIEGLKKEVKSQITELKNEVQATLSAYNKRIESLEENKNHLERQVQYLNRKIRKNNLILFGLKNKENIEETILNLFLQKLEISLTESDINDIYCLGSKTKIESPVLIELVSFKKKQQILKQSNKLREFGITISNDQSREDRETNKILLKHRWQARQKGLQAFIKGDKLHIGRDIYTVKDLENNIAEEEQHISSAPATPNPIQRQTKLLNELGLADPESREEQNTPRVTRSNSNKGTNK